MAVLFFSGWETGDTNEFATVNSGASVQSGTVASGAYAGQVNDGSAGFVCLTGLNAPTLFCRARLRINSASITNPSAFESYQVLSFRDTVPASIAQVRFGLNTDGTLNLRLINEVTGGTLIGSAFTITADTWYLVEFKAVISATVGILEMKVDGTVQATGSSLNTGTTNIDRLQIRNVVGTDNGGTLQYYVDDVYIDDAVYPGAGRCIARQFKSGTPTYNSFSKTGGTNINDVWNDTPFNTGTYASSATSSAAQTGLVASFRSTQGGHGAETIDPTDTINVAQVILYGRTSSTTGTNEASNIRRRVAGANTDNAINFTTSNAYYESPLFSISTTDLETMEAGIAKTAVTATHYVIDVWVQIDYLASGTYTIPKGSFSLTGQALTVAAGAILQIGPASYSLTGTTPTLKSTLTIPRANLVFQGRNVGVNGALILNIAKAAFGFTGTTPLFLAPQTVSVERGYFPLQGRGVFPELTTPSFRQSIFAQETGEVFLVLLTLTHELLAEPVRVVNNTVEIVSRGNTFLPYAFDIDLPRQDGERPPRSTLRIDNVDRSIVVALRSINSAPRVLIEVIMADTPDVVEAGPYDFTLHEATFDALAVEGSLTYEEILDRRFPADTFTPGTHPGLF